MEESRDAVVRLARSVGLKKTAAFRQAFPIVFHLIAERSGQAVAYALYAFDYSTDTGSRTVFLHDLFVRSVARGQGVGQALMLRVMEICKAAGATSMNWLVWHTNESAVGFYERIGAHVVDTVRLMRLDL